MEWYNPHLCRGKRDLLWRQKRPTTEESDGTTLKPWPLLNTHETIHTLHTKHETMQPLNTHATIQTLHTLHHTWDNTNPDNTNPAHPASHMRQYKPWQYKPCTPWPALLNTHETTLNTMTCYAQHVCLRLAGAVAGYNRCAQAPRASDNQVQESRRPLHIAQVQIHTHPRKRYEKIFFLILLFFVLCVCVCVCLCGWWPGGERPSVGDGD
jgi:hypothetical protein